MSTIHYGTASVPNIPSCQVDIPTFMSCQKNNFETPDLDTETSMKEKATSLLLEKGCPTDNIVYEFKSNQIGTREPDLPVSQLRDMGMASNCYRHGSDPNKATHVATMRCNPMGSFIDIESGKKVYNSNMNIHSNLSVCDVSSSAMGQVEEDLKKVAQANAYDNGYDMKVSQLVCNTSLLPQI
jgi:hypothetical protein